MSFDKVLLFLRTNYITKQNNPNQFQPNQVKVKVTIWTTHFHCHQCDTQDIHLYIELKKTNIKSLELFNENIEKYIFDIAGGTAWKVVKQRVISGPNFPVSRLNKGLYSVNLGPNTEKYGPEITPYLETFHAV